MSVDLNPTSPARTDRWYAMTVEEVARTLSVDPRAGLPPDEVAARQAAPRCRTPCVRPRRRRGGSCCWPSSPRVSSWCCWARRCCRWLIGEIEEAVFIAVLLVFNGLLGFWQETKAQRSLAAIEAMVVPQTRVRRDGIMQQVPAEDLVPGDVVLLEAGDTVPADGRLVVAHRLAIAEAALTGEAVPVDKGTGAVPADTVLADRTGMAFTHTAVTAGRAELIVTGTGMATEIGKLATLMGEVEPEPTPLQRQTTKLGHRLAMIAGAAVVLLFTIGLIRGEDVEELIVGSIALAVAAIPEALPATVTVTLAIGMGRLARRRAVVKRLHAVETLGSTSVICSDKTGTLTLNQMTVRTGRARRGGVHGRGAGLRGRGTHHVARHRPGAARPAPARGRAACCATTRSSGTVPASATPPRGALLVLGAKAGIDVAGARQRLPRVGEMPVRLGDQVHGHLPRGPLRAASGPGAGLRQGRGRERAASASTTSPTGTGAASRSPTRAAPRSGTPSTASPARASGCSPPPATGSRAPASTWTGTSSTPRPGLTFLGIVGIVDPPREAAKDAIAAAHRSGIEREDDHRRPPGHRARHRRRAGHHRRRRPRRRPRDDGRPRSWPSRVRRDRRVRPRRPRAQAAHRARAAVARPRGLDDRRRRQRRAGAGEGGHRRRHGHHRHRGDQGSRRHDPARRQLRDDRVGGPRGPHDLREHRQVRAVPALHEPQRHRDGARPPCCSAWRRRSRPSRSSG